MNDVGVAIVGLGRMGYMHGFNIAWRTPRAKLVAVCDMDEDLAKERASEFGCKHYTDLERMLEDPDVDAVCVATPSAHHVEPVTTVAQAGKPLFVEKPLAGTLEDNILLADIIGNAGILCQVGFMRRFDPHYTEAEQMIRDGAIGKPVFYGGIARDPYPPPPWACDPSKGGGLFIDFLLHDFDCARFLMKDEIERVYADETNLVVDSQGIERFADNVTVNLRFRGGALGNCQCSMHSKYGHDVRTEVYGENGTIFIGGMNLTEVTLCTEDRGVSKPRTFLRKAKLAPFAVRFEESYALEMAAFVECVMENKPAKVTQLDALEAYRVSMAAVRSAGEGYPVDLLPE
jgi:scyllo-inositol 2-dehydrogenase (NAD+)